MFKYKKSILLMLVASILFALIGGGKLPYFVLYIIVLIIAIAYFWTRVVVKKLDFSQKIMNNEVYVGDEVEIKTMIFNESPFPVPFIEIENGMIKLITGKLPPSNILSILPFDSRSIMENFKCKYRGYYQLGPVFMNISDVFGMFMWKKEVLCDSYLSVYPRVTKIDKFDIKPLQIYGTSATRQKANEDYSSIIDIRRYNPGDSLKKINWKVSARTGVLQVKNYEMTGSSEVYVFLNLFNEDYDNTYRRDIEEKTVECVASIMYFTLLKNISTILYTNGSRNVYKHGRDLQEFKGFMEELILIKSDGLAPFEIMIETKAKLISQGSSVVLVTPNITQRVVERAARLSEAGFDIIIIYIIMDKVNTSEVRLIEHFGIRLYKIRLNDDVKCILEG